jgi:hypothetical protein
MLLTIVNINYGIAELLHLLESLSDFALELSVLLERLVLLGHYLLESLRESESILISSIRHVKVIVNLEDRSARMFYVLGLFVLY